MKSSVQHCQLRVINPKALSIGELYGYTDTSTLEWSNGILAKTLLLFSQHTEAELQAARERDPPTSPSHTLQTSATSNTTINAEEGEEDSPQGYTVRLAAGAFSDDDEENASSSTSEGLSTDKQTHSGLKYPPCAPVGWRWMLLDGPVDPGWVENLNTVLDDSKLLCLADGERVQLLPGTRVLFETDSLRNASPATVSRCGMVYVVSSGSYVYVYA